MNAVVKQDPLPEKPQGATLLDVISRAASDPSVDIEKMERLWAMKERMDAKQAEIEFNAALSRVQASMGRISADATNKQTSSKYATYGHLDAALRPLYTAEGFSLSFGTEPSSDGKVGMVCYVSHSAGHTRTYKADVPSDGKGAKGGDVMTKTHAFGSGASYGMRYLLKMIFNVAIGEDDDDGNASTQKPKREQAGRPQDGMRLEDMPDARQIVIREHLESIRQFADEGQIDKAAKAWKEAALEHEEKAALWFELPSHHRSALQRVIKRTM